MDRDPTEGQQQQLQNQYFPNTDLLLVQYTCTITIFLDVFVNYKLHSFHFDVFIP